MESESLHFATRLSTAPIREPVNNVVQRLGNEESFVWPYPHDTHNVCAWMAAILKLTIAPRFGVARATVRLVAASPSRPALCLGQRLQGAPTARYCWRKLLRKLVCSQALSPYRRFTARK